MDARWKEGEVKTAKECGMMKEIANREKKKEGQQGKGILTGKEDDRRGL